MKTLAWLKTGTRYSTNRPRSRSCCRNAKILILPALLVAFGSGAPCGESRPTVVCTTTLLGAVAEALAGGGLEIRTVIPWGMCPGHFEPNPREIESVRSANLILAQGMERFLNAFATGEKAPARADIKEKGNWLVPHVQISAAEQTAVVLIKTFPDLSNAIRSNLDAYKKEIETAASDLLKRAAEFKGAPAVCSFMNRDFVEWLGLAPTADFPRDEDLSLRGMRDVIKIAAGKKALLVVENRQSSGKAGQTIARELGVPLVVISNFPTPDANGRCSYVAALRENAEAVFSALREARIR